MSDYPVASRKADFTGAPRAFAANGDPGQVAVLAVSTTAIAVDLTKGISQAAKNLQQGGQDPTSVTRNCLTIGGSVTVGVIFGRTLASVSGTNAPALAAVGTLSSNVYTGAAGTCFQIPAGQAARIQLMPGVDNFVGIVATGAGTVQFYQSSPDTA